MYEKFQINDGRHFEIRGTFEKIGTFTSITIDGKAYQFFQKKGTEDFCLINFNYEL